jgi:hypothetical protein
MAQVAQHAKPTAAQHPAGGFLQNRHRLPAPPSSSVAHGRPPDAPAGQDHLRRPRWPTRPPCAAAETLAPPLSPSSSLWPSLAPATLTLAPAITRPRSSGHPRASPRCPGAPSRCPRSSRPRAGAGKLPDEPIELIGPSSGHRRIPRYRPPPPLLTSS